MQTKEEFYKSQLENRKLVADPQVLKCTCPKTLCEWHGKCKECVAIHRHYNDHIPACLHHIINDKINVLAGVVEMVTEKKESVPMEEYTQYVKERDKK